MVFLNQGASIEGRQITKNTVVAQKLVHKVRNHKGINGMMLIELDMQKAYDRMEWSFMCGALEALGFMTEFQAHILSCLGSVESSTLLNGNACKLFKQEWEKT